MAPLFLPHIRDGFGAIGDGLKGAAGKVADTGGDVAGKTAEIAKTGADGAADLAKTADQANKLMGTFEDLKAQLMEYYPVFLKWQARWKKYKWAFVAALVLWGIIIVLCQARCCIDTFKDFSKCCKCQANCGMSCVKHSRKLGPCCESTLKNCGDCLVGCHECAVGKDAADSRRTDDVMPGCDSTYITRCGNPLQKGEDREYYRLGVCINRNVPCEPIPGRWGRPCTENELKDRLVAQRDDLAKTFVMAKKDGRAQVRAKKRLRRAEALLREFADTVSKTKRRKEREADPEKSY